MCKFLGISERTIERWNKYGIKDNRKGTQKSVPRKLTEAEKEEIYKTCCSEEFKDSNPHEIYHNLLDRGVYLASESSFYRILREKKALAHRTDTREGISRTKPEERVANAPNQVWMWDITWMKSDVTGIWYYAYVIIDLFDRSVIAWAIHDNENDAHSSQLFRDACRKHGCSPNFVHSDNGNPMKGISIVALFYELGIVPSYSRPRVSDDNPFIESFFKTLKYTAGYPYHFNSIEEARIWMADFVDWYNNRHWHSSMQYITPMQKRSGKHVQIFADRNETLNQARELFPTRWGKRPARKYIVKEHELLNPAQKKSA
jgi:transposase InsO family protein